MPRWILPALALACALQLAACGEANTPGSRESRADAEEAPGSSPGPGALEPSPPGAEDDQAWAKRRPFATVLVVGNQRGKLKPCGCSEPQLGGLERLAVLVDGARRRAREGLLAVSLGWVLASDGTEQAETKAALYRQVLEALGFGGLLLGTSDLFVPALAQPYGDGPPLHRPTPPANAPLSPEGPLAGAADTSPLLELEVAGIPVCAMSLLDPAHLARLGGVTRAVYPPDGALGRLPPRSETLWIVGTDATGEAIEAVRDAMARLGPSVIVDLGSGTGSAPREDVRLGEQPVIVSLGVLGKEAGVLDLDPDPSGTGWRMSWHVVELDPSFERAESPLRDRVASLFDTYKDQVRARGYLLRHPTWPDAGQAHYVGSGRCVRCHPGIYESWRDTAHAHALETLEARSYHWDPECVRCHVVGFERMNDGRWTRMASGFVSPERTPFLAGVGCESCHGPGSEHVARPEDRTLWGPGGPNHRHPGRKGCEACHDVENSHAFGEHYENVYLPAIDHRRVPTDRRIVRGAEDR